MAPRSGTDRMQFRLIIVFLILSLLIGLTGYFYYYFQKQQLTTHIQNELSAIADLKISQITNWRNERLEDAMVIVKNPLIAEAFQLYLQHSGTTGQEHELLGWMKSLKEIAGYQSVLLVDPRGNVRMTTAPDLKAIGPYAKQMVQVALRSGQSALSDFHKSAVVPHTHLDLVAPLSIQKGKDSSSIGALVIRINPETFLYPLIQTWPGSSKSAETLLVRKDGDSVLFLNELRHRKDTALSFRIQLDKKRLPAAMAIQGVTGVFEGIDYREAPVLAAARPVPGTPWFLIAKVDIEEIYASVRKQARLLSFVIAVLIAGAGLIILFWWRKETAEEREKYFESELARKTLSRQYDYLSKFANDIILLVDPDGNIREANDRAVTAYGHSRDELLRLSLRDLRPPETQPDITAQMNQVRERNGLIFESVHKRKDGSTFPVEISSRVIDNGGSLFFQSIIRDITERKRAENTLRKRNAFIEAIMDNLPIGLAVNRVADGKTIYMNAAFEEIYGWPKNILTDVEEFFIRVYPDPDYRKKVKEKVLYDIASGDPLRMIWDNVRITTQTGATKFVTAINIPLIDQDLMISTVLDITARKKAEEALIESEHRFKRLIETVTDYIYSVEVINGSVVRTQHGPGCVTVTGYTSEEYQADPELWSRMIFDGDRNMVIEQARLIISGASMAPFEHRIIHKDGSLRWIKNTSVPHYDNEGRLVSYDGLISDITQLKTLETQLRQAQKMEAVGQLAGGVAHDFNNILTAIIGYAHLLLMKIPEQDPARAFVEPILVSAERAAHLTSSLLSFSRKQIIDLQPVDLNTIIRRVEHLLGRVIGEDVEFQTVLVAENLIVMADSVQIEQVLMNLATNARDAMPQGGVLRVQTEALTLGEDFIRTHSYGAPGNYVCLSVTDTGVGMDEKTRNKIFEPFFTTKEVGKGTGLGLSMVYGIIKQHHGYIFVSSSPEKGTTFKIYLPLITVAPLEQTARDYSMTAWRGAETVLLAEDDKSVRDLTRCVLEGSGYTVIEAVDGGEAVRKFVDNKEVVSLLILDMIRPKKNGREAYREIKNIRADIKALFMSGYTADIAHKKGIFDDGFAIILKPVTPSDLLKKVREILDRR